VAADPGTSGRPKQTAEWERKRREILAVAADVFFTHGFQKGTTKEIAERVGLSQSTLYHYVGSKDDLMGEIAEQVDRDFTQALDEAEALGGPPRERLDRVIDAFVGALMLNQRTFGVYWKEFRSIPAELAKKIAADEQSFARRVEAVVGEVQAAGQLPADHPTRLISQGILGMMSWTHWWYRSDEFTAEQVAAAYKALIGLPPTS
jgi:AcrR family transcriptional regulator